MTKYDRDGEPIIPIKDEDRLNEKPDRDKLRGHWQVQRMDKVRMATDDDRYICHPDDVSFCTCGHSSSQHKPFGLTMKLCNKCTCVEYEEETECLCKKYNTDGKCDCVGVSMCACSVCYRDIYFMIQDANAYFVSKMADRDYKHDTE